MEFSCLNFNVRCVGFAFPDVTVNFVEPRVEVAEGAGMAEICVEKNLQTIPDLVVSYAARDGTAIGHEDTFIIGSAYGNGILYAV